eukprot:CAMPEP_0116571238 /NCGR_PEP_ID=MMETSP0397-20121206/17440_1 /TAXON_ID=216820 /ORGANISM="Cyclophora tenuis, Strain ECT3854" /LENGTH=92 /DNA_ID=CAMNT_0004099295 /DNA_START=12 /DNA_END=287 /DNA_ORIENTATION=-
MLLEEKNPKSSSTPPPPPPPLLPPLSAQQRRHVYKYFAMARVGGGWVAQSNVFPLHPFYGTPQLLPNKGKLTVYVVVDNDDGTSSFTPCLMS